MTAKYELAPTNQFKRDIKKRWAELLDSDWVTVANCLINDVELPMKYRDHELKGNHAGIRECHIKPDLLLMYEKQEQQIILIRIGTHSELFG